MKNLGKSSLFIVSIALVSSSLLFGLSPRAEKFLEGLQLLGVEIKEVSKKPETNFITYTAIFGPANDAGITCTQERTTNDIKCSLFEYSNGVSSNSEEVPFDDALAWQEILESLTPDNQ